MKKNDWQSLPEGSAEYVVTHGAWASQRGRRPSCPYKGISNPAKALRAAAVDHLIHVWQSQEVPAVADLDRNLVHVWHESQKVPAAAYGDAHYGKGNYEIRVSADAAQARDKEGGIVYYFS